MRDSLQPEKVGLVTISGLNPAAAVAEAGIEVETRSMCGTIEFYQDAAI